MRLITDLDVNYMELGTQGPVVSCGYSVEEIDAVIGELDRVKVEFVQARGLLSKSRRQPAKRQVGRKKNDRVPVAQRREAVLNAMKDMQQPVTAADLAKKIKAPKATIARILQDGNGIVVIAKSHGRVPATYALEAGPVRA
jgi:hypothetical protein